MYEKQYSIKDTTELKNKFTQAFQGEYTCDFNDKAIAVSKNGKTVFNGEITLNPIGYKLKGEFNIDKIISKAAFVIVVIYILILLGTYYLGLQFYDYQIFIMIIAAASIVILKKIPEKKTEGIKNILESISYF